ncbi:UDP-N-acetylmuramate--L-alanine ligase [soil metagenome]
MSTRETGLGPDGLRGLVAAGPVHFMGAGGAGMCALAEAVARAGGTVTACDRKPGSAVRALEALGVTVLGGHDPSHVEGIAGLVVTAAVPEGHPELRRARELGIPVVKRAAALGSWVSAGRVAAVAGTHGKTTTTALLTAVLEAAGMDPTGFVGGEVPSWKSNLRPGRDDLFVVEADEYDRSFHHLNPDVTVVTNMEADHLDIYGDMEGVRDAFHRYLEGVRPGGSVWACADDPGAASLLTGVRGEVSGHSYGFSAGAELRGERPTFEGGLSSMRIRERGVSEGRIRLGIPGMHNLRNALGAAAAARSMGVEWDAIREGLAGFSGVRRRFQRLGEVEGVQVVDDYAHHPTEVEAALLAARATAPTARLVAVFQPHLYTRTRDFHLAFGRALAAADVVWITAIYPAREEPLPGVDAAMVVRATRAAAGAAGAATEVHLHDALETLPEAVAASLRPGDLCLTMGAGSIESVGGRIVTLLSDAASKGRDHA